jgi:hypothetical protein
MPPRLPNNPGVWPRFMRAATAAAYVDEVSVECFLRKVGTVYPGPSWGKGRGARWDKETIDLARTASDGTLPTVFDAANVL